MADAPDNAEQQETIGVWLVSDRETLDEYAPMVHHLVVGLLDAAVRVTLVAPGPAAGLEELAPVAVVHYAPPSRFFRRRRIEELAGRLIGDKAKLIHCLSPESAVVGAELARQTNVPYVVGVLELTRGVPRRIQDPDLCAGLIAHHERIAVALREDSPPHVGELVRYAPVGLHLVGQGRRPTDASPHPRSIIARGRLAPGQGFEQLIEAFRVMIDKEYDLMLFLIGSGPLERSLRRSVSEWDLAPRVTFVPSLADSGRILAGADVYVQPRAHRRVDLDVLEAMAAGLPVVAAHDQNGLDVVTDERDGLLFPVFNTDALGTRLQRVLDDEDLAARLADAARATIVREHLASKMVAALLSIYRDTILRRSTFQIQRM